MTQFSRNEGSAEIRVLYYHSLALGDMNKYTQTIIFVNSMGEIQGM